VLCGEESKIVLGLDDGNQKYLLGAHWPHFSSLGAVVWAKLSSI